MSAPVGGAVKLTAGFLLELRARKGFVERGCELLKMKRDQLASKVRELMDQLGKRRELEKRLEEAYKVLKEALLSVGASELTSMASSVNKAVEIEVKPKSVMGVLVPLVKVKNLPLEENVLANTVVCEVAKKFHEVLKQVIEVGTLEATLERVAMELASTNRKVNALEKIVLPGYDALIKYIEEVIEDSELEEFCKTKKVREVIRRKGR